MVDDYQNLMLLINKESFYNIDFWSKIDLASISGYNKKLGMESGIYAIKDATGIVLYIGKAKSIHGRLKSHFKATTGGEKAEAWKQFFEHYQEKNLVAHYFIVDQFSAENEENARKALERILQIKYRPLFDRVYSAGHKRLDNFITVINELSLVK